MSATAGRAVVEVHLDEGDWASHLAAETARGLRDRPPWTPPVWFYDEVGSRLFDRITGLEEYYPTRAERAVLAASATDIARRSGATTLVELGSGTSAKTTLLLDALDDAGTLERFVALDVSEAVLREAADSLAERRPGLEVRAIVGDFHRHLGRVPAGGRRLVAFLGGTIGNLDRTGRAQFLAEVAAMLGPGDALLLGTDLVKDPARLVRAYDDSAGVTAAFNRNALAVMNRELGADFEPGAYAHRAHWDPARQWIEMHLVARSAQRVRVSSLGVELHLGAGEHLRTEISAKFTPAGVGEELAAAGLEVQAGWTDPAGDFLVTLAGPRHTPG